VINDDYDHYDLYFDEHYVQLKKGFPILYDPTTKQNEVFVLDKYKSRVDLPMDLSIVSKPSTVIVRKYGKTKGGTRILLPTSLQDLLEIGGKELGIKAVAVRDTTQDEAQIKDLDILTDQQVVYLTTADDEESF